MPNQPPLRAESEIAIGRREQLFHLLAEASEIEHTLMCSYLYAAFSLRVEGAGLTTEEAVAARRWRKVILGIATEEMVHLLLVANLTVALGGRPHFARPNFPVSPGYFPSDVAVRLSPFSSATIDHFVYLERPDSAHEEDGEGFAAARTYDREEAYHGLMPSIQDYSTVGRLYEALKVNLESLVQLLGEEPVFLGPQESQIGPANVSLPGVQIITDLASALASIERIVEQGEGARIGSEVSHYARFKLIADEFAALRAANPDFQPAWPAAENPVMRRPPEPAGKVFVDHPQAARVLDFGNAVYGQLLRLLVQAFGCQGADASKNQTRCMNGAIGLMHVLGRVGSALAAMPAVSEGDEVNAGLTFTMLRSLDPIVGGIAGERLGEERLRELENGGHVAAMACPALAGVNQDVLKIRREMFSSSTTGARH